MKYMRSNVVQPLVYGQLYFYLGLALCAFLKPGGLSVNEGISYYGVFWLTVVPYSIGLFGSAYFCFRFVSSLGDSEEVVTKFTFTLMALLICGVALTPDTLNRFFNDAHMTFGSLLFILQLLYSAWLFKRLNYDSLVLSLGLVELLAGVISFIYLGPRHGYLLESQVVFQVSYGLLSIYALPKLLSRSADGGAAENPVLKHAHV